MADTLPNVILTPNTWIDLYAETGIPVGTKISVDNVGVNDIYLTVQATQPPVNHDAYTIIRRESAFSSANDEGDSGAWAYSPMVQGKLNVRIST